tara:strand:+ start:11179 stop:15114 length:3936 start_codon:yes stop_codon:yes gene_type:complete
MIQLKVYPNVGAPNDTSLFLDLYETQPIKLTLSIEDITSADATSVFSRTFKVPGTRTNNIFFKNAFEIDGTDFDITIKKPAEILVNGTEFKTGHVRLQKIFANEDLDKIDYELLFLGETRDFSSAIGELTMCQLTLTDFDWDGLPVSYTNAGDFAGAPGAAQVEASWGAWDGINGTSISGLADGDLLFPLIDHGNSYDNDGDLIAPTVTLGSNGQDESFNHQANALSPQRLKPMIRGKRLWDQIFENAGYTYESSFLGGEQFRHMYLSAFGNNENASLDVEQSVAQIFEVFDIGNTGDNDVDSYLYMPNIVFGDPAYQINVPDVGSGAGGSYFTAPGDAQIGGSYYSFDYGAQVDAAIENSDYGYTNVDVAVQLCIVSSVGGTITQVLDTGSWNSGGNWSSSSYDSRNGGYQPQTGDIFQIYVTANYAYDISSVDQCYWHCHAAPGDYYPLRDLDCEYQQIDFIKDIITMFRLVMQPAIDRPNHFIIEPWQDFIGSGDVYDWSHKLIREKDFVSEPLFNTQSAQIEYTMQEDEDFINVYHQDNNKHAYGWLRFNSANELLKGKRDVEVTGIAPTPIDNIINYSTNGSHDDPSFIIPQIFEVTGEQDQHGQNERLPIKPKSRFLFYNGLATINNSHSYWYMAGSNGNQGNGSWSAYPLVSPYEYWPILNVPEIPPAAAINTLNLNFANDTRYFMDPDPGATIYGQIPNTLFDEFWARYVSSLYNKFSRRVTAYFTLNNVDLQTLTFDDVIFIDGKYYRPEKIIDAQIGERTAVKCELITIKDQRIYWPNEPLTGFSIVVNDGQCFGDTGSVQVTTNGTPNFTWTITGTGQTGVYSAPVGQAPYIFTVPNVPIGTDELVVTDSFGRTSIITFTVVNNNTTPVTTTNTHVDATDCGPTSCNGELTVTATSGATPITVTFQDGFTGTLPITRTGLCPNDYLYYATDNLGCQSVVETISISCNQSTTYYEVRQHLNSCTQVSSTILIADVDQGVGTNPQVGDTVSLSTSTLCYVVTGTTTSQPSYIIDNIYADCPSCTATVPDSYLLESCDTQGSFQYADRNVVLTPNQVVELVGQPGCWVVRGDNTNAPFINQVANVYATCSDCATSFTYYAYACDTSSFPPRQFNSLTQLNIGGVYKISSGANTGICVEILQQQVSTGSNDSLNPLEYTDCDDCQGISPPAQQFCTTLNNTSFVGQTFSYVFNGTTFSNQLIGSGQSRTVCAESGTVTVSDPSVQINVSSNVCTSTESCNLFTCQEYTITNISVFPEGSYKYTDCSGTQLTGILAIGNSVVVCAIKPPKTEAGLDVEANDSLCI